MWPKSTGRPWPAAVEEQQPSSHRERFGAAGKGDRAGKVTFADEGRAAGGQSPAVGGGLDLGEPAARQTGEIEVAMAIDLDLQLPQLRRGGFVGGRDLPSDLDRDRSGALARQSARRELPVDRDP
jgi:hypothetical protein